MNRETRLVWLGTSVAVAVVWAVSLSQGGRAPSRLAASAAGSRSAEAAGRAEPTGPAASAKSPERSTAPESAQGAAKPDTQAASAAPAVPVPEHPKSPGQILPSAFSTETPDPYWAKDAETTIRSAFADAEVPEGALVSVECRRRVCKAEMWFDSREHLAFGRAYETLREHFGIDVGFEHISHGIRGEPEHLAAYFPRKGYALKDFESPSR